MSDKKKENKSLIQLMEDAELVPLEGFDMEKLTEMIEELWFGRIEPKETRLYVNITKRQMRELGWIDEDTGHECDSRIYYKRCGDTRYWLDIRDMNSVCLNYGVDGMRTLAPLYKFTNRSISDDIQSIKDIMDEFNICYE